MSISKRLQYWAAILGMSIPLASQAATLQELADRMEYLEDSLILAEESNEELREALDKRVKITGYTDLEYHVEEGSNSHFRLHHLSLFFQKKLDEKWSFFSEIEYEDAPKHDLSNVTGYDKDGEPILDGTKSTSKELVLVSGTGNGKIFVEAVNMDFKWRPEMMFRFGRFFTPAGLWSVDHYPPYVPTQIRPEHIRQIFPQVFDGIMTFGTLRYGNYFLDYNAYVGNGEGNTGKDDNNGNKAVGGKASLLLPVPKVQHAEVGASYYFDKLNDAGYQDVEKTAIGMHAKFRVADFSFQSEAAYAKFKRTSGGNNPTKSGYYAQLSYAPENWAVGYRYDNYDSDRNAKGELTTNTLFLNYRFSPTIVSKIEHHFINDVLENDFTKTIVSIVAYLE